MAAWDATRTSVGIDNPQSTSDSTTPKESANGNASGRSTPSIEEDGDDSYGASISASSHSQGIIMLGKREVQGATVLESSSPEEGSLDSLPPLHNAITKDMPSNPVKTYRRNNSSASASSYQSSSHSLPRDRELAYDLESSYQSSSHSLPRDRELAYDAADESRYRSASGASGSIDNEYVYADDDIDDVDDVDVHGLNGGMTYGASVEVNGNGHLSHEAKIDDILEAGDYADSGVPEEIRSELETTSASSSYSSRVNSQISKASTDSDDDRPLRVNTNISHRESLSSSPQPQEAQEHLGGGSPTTKPKSPSCRSPRKPKCPPPPRPTGGPPSAPAPRPKGPPPPAPRKPKHESPKSSREYANHRGRGSDDDTQYSVSALRQKFDFARRGSDESTGRRGSGDGPVRAPVGRSGSYREPVNVQASVGRSSSIGSYDSGRDELEVKLSDRTLESLERNMPRRTRRSVGEGKHKSRRTSDEAMTESDRSSMASSRASEGESSSDEGAVKMAAAYQSAASPLPDLPEDQVRF